MKKLIGKLALTLAVTGIAMAKDKDKKKDHLAPEIDPSTAIGALTLAGGMLMLSRRKK